MTMMNIRLPLLSLAARIRSRVVCVANETASPVLDAIAAVFVANELKEDGWVQLSPFGRFPNAQGLQEFARSDAEAIVNEFESLKNTPQRLLGLPWYIGHPDHPRFADKYRDTKAYGRIKALEVRDDGLFANVKWSAAGRQLVEDGAFHGHSVNWRVRKVGAVFRPFSLKSVGFTNDPQIPVQPALANETQPTTDMLPKWLIEMLVAAGALKADAAAPATEEEAKALLAPFFANSAKLPVAEADKAKAETALANEVAAHGVTKGRLATAETGFVNERKAHAASLLSAAEKEGRLKPADRAAFEAEFANEFGSAAARLAALKPELKTERRPARFGTTELVSTTGQRRERTRQMVNERMKQAGEDYDTAFAWVQANKSTS